ncbi:peptidyl-tRNA hydrolase, mitochondrial-like [Asparagus officinalis]|uniref:peptidyl-tRNA hydrolase, mitochondrial-like n=1 Tax=Asparagus officinalis TaxID=4686 RepID=UPI00098E2AED|nr:peptidyl-tRNA hydrolase, mitochondrial-like [Asparagus officinalis]
MAQHTNPSAEPNYAANVNTVVESIRLSTAAAQGRAFSMYLTDPNVYRSSMCLAGAPVNQCTACLTLATNDMRNTCEGGDESAPMPWLFVGLGNPGRIYQGTRHSVGFEMIDAIAEAEGISVNSICSKALFGKGYIGDVPIMLAKPQTFMNSSGESVGSLISYFKVPLNQVLLIYDDMDLPFAKLRLLPKGGHGGHNGMRSVINHFNGSREFPRLKIGIGRPPGKMDPVNFVLRPFCKKEQEELDFTFQRGLDALRILVLEGFNKSATFTNSAQPSELLS